MLFIDNTSTNSYFNLAMEEYLLNNFTQDVCMLWQNDNTVVVGKNQNALAEIDYDYVKANDIKVVRRLTGGGAVFHDMGNLNYTFITNNTEDNFSNFKTFSTPVIDMLDGLGIHAYLTGRNDLVIDGRKFSGNAQCVHKNRLLHHGTLLFCSDIKDISASLKVDPEKIADKGIKSVASRVTNISEHLQRKMSVAEFKKLFMEYMLKREDVTYYNLTPDDIAKVQKLSDEKYSTWEWNFGYSPKYAFHKKKRFSAGSIEVSIDVKDGIMQDVKFYGDFFARRDVSEIEQLLKSQKHNFDVMNEVLNTVNLNDYFLNISKQELLSVLI